MASTPTVFSKYSRLILRDRPRRPQIVGSLPDREKHTAPMNLDNSPARIRAQLFYRILLTFSAICFAFSSPISSQNTASWHQTAADGGFSSEKYNARLPVSPQSLGQHFLPKTSESGPISDESETKTGQSSNDPATSKIALVIYFKNNQAISPPHLGIFDSSQQSTAEISKIYENLPEAAAHTARPDGAPFILAKTRYVFQPLTADPLGCRKNVFQNGTQSWTNGVPPGGASNPAQLNRTATY
jgi:hypothetical protein